MDDSIQINPNMNSPEDSVRPANRIITSMDDIWKHMNTVKYLHLTYDAEVMVFQDNRTDKLMVVKFQKFTEYTTRQNLENEVDISMALSPFKYFPTFIEAGTVVNEEEEHFIAMELFSHDTLGTFSDDNDLSEVQIKFILYQLAQGLLQMHSMGILHRDIKCRNIVVNDRGVLQIIDFGLSCRGIHQPGGRRSGTHYTMAPEMYRYQPYDSSADFYSYGRVAHYLYFGVTETNFEDFTFHLPPNSELSSTTVDFLTQLLEVDPKNRLTGEAVLDHPYFNDISLHEMILKEDCRPLIKSGEGQFGAADCPLEDSSQEDSSQEDGPQEDDPGDYCLRRKSRSRDYRVRDYWPLDNFVRENL